MVYDVRVTGPGDARSSFELRRDEPLKVGDFISKGTMVYTVRLILPSDEFDAIVEAVWKAGPAQARV